MTITRCLQFFWFFFHPDRFFFVWIIYSIQCGCCLWKKNTHTHTKCYLDELEVNRYLEADSCWLPGQYDLLPVSNFNIIPAILSQYDLIRPVAFLYYSPPYFHIIKRISAIDRRRWATKCVYILEGFVWIDDRAKNVIDLIMQMDLGIERPSCCPS